MIDNFRNCNKVNEINIDFSKNNQIINEKLQSFSFINDKNILSDVEEFKNENKLKKILNDGKKNYTNDTNDIIINKKKAIKDENINIYNENIIKTNISDLNESLNKINISKQIKLFIYI